MAGGKGSQYLQQCRLCRDTDGELTNIFGEDGLRRNLTEKINVCLSLLVRQEDPLPKLICLKCIQMVEKLYGFRKMCAESEVVMESSLPGDLLEPECCVKELEMIPQMDRVKYNDNHHTSEVSEDCSSGTEELPNGTGETDELNVTVPDEKDTSSMQIGEPRPENYVLMKEESFILNRDQDNHRATTIEFLRSSIHESDRDILLIQKKRREILPQMWDVYEKTMTSENVIAVTHRRYIINKSAFPCSLCGKCFDINQGVCNDSGEVARLTCTERKDVGSSTETSFPCHVCGKVFSHSNQLKRHLQTHFNYKLFACSLCGRAFSRKEHLTRHTLSHTGGRPYHCDICNKLFTRKEHLTRHRLCHPLSVKQEDDGKLSSDEPGSAHVVDHLRPFACEFCGHSFSRKDHLSQHQRRLHHLNYQNGDTSDDPKPYVCCICKKNFTRKEHLVRHQGIHVREFILGSSETVTDSNLSFPLVSPH